MITAKEMIKSINDDNFTHMIKSLIEIDKNDDIDEKYSNYLVEQFFKAYAICRKNKIVYDYGNVPKNLLHLYYTLSKQTDFTTVMNKFKNRYILQESRVEQVHSKAEREGLGLLYDYISSDEWKKMYGIYTILKLHSVLFSKTPHPEAGGSFRTIPVYLPGTGIPTTDPDFIFKEVTELNNTYMNLLEEGIELGKNNHDGNVLIDYINRCIKLKCDLIRIHPFYDGNGRTMRALTNILFKVAGLPPVYVKSTQRKIYEEAMNKAIVDNDYSKINKFYYYRLCDSIYTLDMEDRRKQRIGENISKTVDKKTLKLEKR